MELRKWEIIFLKYYSTKYNAKWIRVYRNKHGILDTIVVLYNVYKKKLKKQARTGQQTFTHMFRYLKEGDWYYIPDLLLQLQGGRKEVEESKDKN
jgi:hypothetical protein